MVLDDNTRDSLERCLTRLLRECDLSDQRRNDPVQFVWNYERDADREVVALVAATLAYGRVEKLLEAIERALVPLGNQPAAALKADKHWRTELQGFSYRMTDGEDLADLFAAISVTLSNEGSLQALYASTPREPHLTSASAFVRTLRSRRLRDECERGFRYLLPDPADGSACKRLNMFFRWVGRGPDDIDPGLWTSLSSSELVVPMDTHTSRISRYIGLTRRKTVDWKMAEDVTESLRQLDAEDPTRFDFALAHLGIADDCIHQWSEDHCPNCPIEPICQIQ